MIPLHFRGVLPLLSLYVGALLSTGASLACPHPPCRESLVAAPIQADSGVGMGTRACEGQTGTTSCRMGVALLAISDAPRRVEHRHSPPQVQPKVSKTAASSYVLDFSVNLKDYCTQTDISKSLAGLSIKALHTTYLSITTTASLATCNLIFLSLESEILKQRAAPWALLAVTDREVLSSPESCPLLSSL